MRNNNWDKKKYIRLNFCIVYSESDVSNQKKATVQGQSKCINTLGTALILSSNSSVFLWPKSQYKILEIGHILTTRSLLQLIATS